MGYTGSVKHDCKHGMSKQLQRLNSTQSSRESIADKQISQEQPSPWTWMLQGMVIP